MGTRKIFLTKSYEAAQAIARGFKVGEDGVTCVGRGTVIGSCFRRSMLNGAAAMWRYIQKLQAAERLPIR